MLYQSHVAPQTPSTPAARLAAEQLREARQPADSFGSRVHRHLRGRWFSLVPVSRLAITTVVAVILLIPIGLTLLHHLAVTWPALAYRGSIARPLRVDQPDSFAAWWLTLVLAFSAGPVRLIYALRRHRRDDFRGHYQLWRFTLVVLLVASVHSTVGLVSWLGALMDLVIGDRAVLSGANWLRIVLDVGGIILAMRLIAEVHRCRPALIAMVAAATFLGISEAAAWRLIEVNSYAMSTLVLSAPLLGGSCLFAAATIYLRLLYRQVRNIAVEPTIGERLTQWWADRREMNAEPELKLADLDPRPVDAPAAATTRTRPPANERNDAASNRDQEQCEENSQSETDGQDVSEPKKAGFFSRFKRKPKSQSLNRGR